MNIALPALIVFVLLLPGFVFRSRLKLVERTSVDFSPFGRVVTEGVLWAGALHAIWLIAAYLVCSQEFRLDVLLRLLSSDHKQSGEAIDFIGKRSADVIRYFASLYLGAYFLPRAVRFLVSHWRLDRLGGRWSTLFRFHDAPWYYLLTGADYLKDECPDYVLVSAVVDIAGEAYLYTGVLDDYFFDSEGNLDRLVITGTKRRSLSKDRTGESSDGDRFYEIPGDYFVIRYSDALTLNVRMVKLEKDDNQALSSTLLPSE